MLVGSCAGSSGTDGPSTPSPAPGTGTSIETSPTPATSATGVPSTSGGTVVPGAPGGWTVDAATCPDPDAAAAPIAGRLTIAVVAPTSGGVAAAAWKATIDGFQEALTRANFDGDLGELNLDVVVVDDGADPQRAAIAVQSALDDGAQVVAGVAGDAANLSLRFTLNEQCIPQLFGFAASPELGEVGQYPWTTAIEPTTDREVQVAGTLLTNRYPDGGTVGLYTADDERGDAYRSSVTAGVKALQLDVIDDEVVVASSSAAPDAVARLAAARPDVVMAAPAGLDCAYFLRELSIRRNLSPDWRPVVVLDSRCATSSVLGLAGPGADGVYSTSNLVDPTSEANAALPGVVDYTKWMTTRGLAAEIPGAVAGWTAGEAVVATVQRAVTSPGGLSRVSLLESARSLALTPTLGRRGVVLRTDGERDPFPAESAQVVQWNADRRAFDDVGELVTRFET